MAPNDASKSVFFSNVPYTTTVGYLKKIFSKVGHLEDLELYTDSSGTSIGAGVATFDTAALAEHAVSQLHDSQVDGRPMLVKANDRERRQRGTGDGASTVFFNGVPYATTEGFLRAKFERHGRIVDFDLWRRPGGDSQGMGTCEYSSAAEAQSAIQALNSMVVDGRRMLVQPNQRPEGSSGAPPARRRVTSRPMKGAGKGNPDCRVFWSNVSPATTEGYLRSQFERVGTIVDFDFWRRPDGTSLGMGVCEFDHYLGSWRSQEQLHGMELDGSRLLVKSDDGGKAGAGSWSGGKGRGKGGGKGKKGKY